RAGRRTPCPSPLRRAGRRADNAPRGRFPAGSRRSQAPSHRCPMPPEAARWTAAARTGAATLAFAPPVRRRLVPYGSRCHRPSFVNQQRPHPRDLSASMAQHRSPRAALHPLGPPPGDQGLSGSGGLGGTGGTGGGGVGEGAGGGAGTWEVCSVGGWEVGFGAGSDSDGGVVGAAGGLSGAAGAGAGSAEGAFGWDAGGVDWAGFG